MKPPNIGAMRHRMTLVSQTQGVDAYQGPTTSYTGGTAVWASIRVIGGRERAIAEQYAAEATVVIRIRYRTGVNAKTRVEFGSRRFDVLWPDNVEERNRYLDLYCVERQL